jgi:hypothetical protein
MGVESDADETRFVAHIENVQCPLAVGAGSDRQPGTLENLGEACHAILATVPTRPTREP